MLSNIEYENYIARRRTQALSIIRAGFLAGLLFNSLFLLFDVWSGLDLDRTMPLRGLWSGVLLTGIGLTFVPRGHDGLAWVVGIGGCVGAWMMAEIMLLDSVPARHVPGLITLFIAAVGMAPSVRSAGFTIAALVLVPTVVLLSGGRPLTAVLEVDAFLGMAAIMCALVCHLLEQSHKRAFRLERALERKATTDSLTGLANRRYFFDRAEIETMRHGRLSALMLDVDHFKRINDQFGHDVGDQVLMAVAAQLRGCARDSDVLARTGGEEFALLAVGAGIAEAAEIGERMRAAIARLDIRPDGEALKVTISVGCAEMAPDEDGIDAALKRADQALYQAKHGGRDRVVAAPLSERAEIGLPPLEESSHGLL